MSLKPQGKMASSVFDGVDNDLLLCLMEFMSNKDLASFSRTCRPIYDVAKPLLAVREEYTVVELTRVNAFDLIEAIRMQPGIAKHIKTVVCNLSPTEYEFEEPHRIETCEYFSKRAHELPYTDDTIEACLGPFIEEGVPCDALVTFTTSVLCSNLEKLELIGRAGLLEECLMPVIRDIHATKSSAGFPGSRNLVKPLSRISELSLCFRHTSDTYLGFSTFLCLLSIPTLRTVTLDGLGLERDLPPTHTRSFWGSNIEFVRLIDCYFADKGNLRTLVSGLPMLKRLIYQPDDEEFFMDEYYMAQLRCGRREADILAGSQLENVLFTEWRRSDHSESWNSIMGFNIGRPRHVRSS